MLTTYCKECGNLMEIESVKCADCVAGKKPVPEDRIPFVPASVEKDGDQFIATGEYFTNLQESFDYAFGETEDEARANYSKKLYLISDLKRKIIDCDKFYYETIKPFYEEFTAAKESLLALVGEGYMFQDDESGIVFKVIIPKGTFVSYQIAGIDRTKREGERAGSLSMKEAKEAGFTDIPDFKEPKI